MAGLISSVRPSGEPCRPTKFRFEEEAEICAPSSLSGFIARHIEQPAPRHSNPAASNTSRSPSEAACSAMRRDPGTTSALTPDFTCRPCTTRAASRRSVSRLFVHEPMKATSIGVPASGAPGRSRMWPSAAAMPSRSSPGARSGSGIVSVTDADWPGLVPQVTTGSMSVACSTTSSS